MRKSKNWFVVLLFFVLSFGVVLTLSVIPVAAGDRVLSNNKGETSDVWFITGEPTLVMNGFDLSPLGIALPAVIDRVSIAVDTSVSGATIDVVVYQDANGGSPVDAVLAGQMQTTINQSGVVTITFPTPVTVTQPVIWIGFYLPVDFKFLADTSGASVLTYWAWTSGGRFNLANLASAQVLGPADGTAPVNLNMKGIARINAEISSRAATTTTPGLATVTPGPTAAAGTPLAVITQVIAVDSVNLSVLQTYPPACDTLSRDTSDMGTTYRSAINITCTAIWPGYAPVSPLGYNRRQLLYDLAFYNDKGIITDWLPEPVTHCVLANPAEIDVAVIGLATGAPRRWELLPTIRVGDLICAEVKHGGSLSYFIPGTETPTPTPTATPK